VEISEVCQPQELVRKVQVHEEVLEYAVALVEATRNHPAVSLGVSPRGSIALIRAAQARAAKHDRDFVGPEDVKYARFRNAVPAAMVEKFVRLEPEAFPGNREAQGGEHGPELGEKLPLNTLPESIPRSPERFQTLLVATGGSGRVLEGPVEAVLRAREERTGLVGFIADCDDVVEGLL
jgi:hypothetical protein